MGKLTNKVFSMFRKASTNLQEDIKDNCDTPEGNEESYKVPALSFKKNAKGKGISVVGSIDRLNGTIVEASNNYTINAPHLVIIGWAAFEDGTEFSTVYVKVGDLFVAAQKQVRKDVAEYLNSPKSDYGFIANVDVSGFEENIYSIEVFGSEDMGTLYKIPNPAVTVGIMGNQKSRLDNASLDITSKKLILDKFCDVLFVVGCDFSACFRYRVAHPIEQLLTYNIVSDWVFYPNISMEMIKHFRMFVIYRCPWTEELEKFVIEAKSHNKVVLYDTDDLVIDLKYTNTIKHLDTLPNSERALYDDGVERMGRMLQLCDGVITTTERLAEELKNFVPEVFINRNVASAEMMKYAHAALKQKETASYENISKNRIANGRIRIGYFSGSITHNDDVKMLVPVFKRILKAFPNVEFHLAGELTLPVELREYKDRIISRAFVDWRKLPELLMSVDINLAPLEKSIFNEAKSEIKWIEASLVKTPTIASRIGAFERMIQHGKTGLLCESQDEWFASLKLLIADEKLRFDIGNNAYDFCVKHCFTLNTGKGLSEYLLSKMTTNVFFVLPSVNISGGVLVAMKHCTFLKKAGYDVTIWNQGEGDDDVEFDGDTLYALQESKTMMFGIMDKAVATMHITVPFAANPNVKSLYYLVQNYESKFYPYDDFNAIRALQTYARNIFKPHYITISKWCQDWLCKEFGKESGYAPNGLNIAQFYPKNRRFDGGVVRILIEGSSNDEYKNVDEAFKIVKLLDKNKYEVWYLSYQGLPKSWYHVDKFLLKVPYKEVADVYRNCHILLKTSILESFSYPPLEMMSTGGFVVARPNGGNVEFLQDGVNCLFYDHNDLDSAVAAIECICNDDKLRDTLYNNGIETAKTRNWDNVVDDVLALYTAEGDHVYEKK